MFKDITSEAPGLRPDLVSEPPFSLAELEELYIRRIYRDTQSNKTECARVLGITIKTMYNKLEAYGILEEERQVRAEHDNLLKESEFDNEVN